MIPYAVLMAELFLPGRSLEIRALDPVPGGFTFRVSRQRAADPAEMPERAECLFLDHRAKRYRKVTLAAGQFSVRPEAAEPDDPLAPYAAYYRFTSDEPGFLAELQRVLADYTAYIHLKLENDELTAMEKMTGHTLSGRYPQALSEWQAAQPHGADWREPLKTTELAVSLDTPSLWDAFLALDRQEFLRFYWQENGLTGHPITTAPITHIYLGNSWCPLLWPEDSVKALLDRTLQESFIPVVVFSSMPEQLTDVYRSRLLCLSKWVEMHEPLELVLNDWGTTLLIRDAGLSDSFSITLGPLLMKRKKDVRMPWCTAAAGEAYDRTSLDSDYAAVFLQSLSVMRKTYEVCGRSLHISGTGNVLQLPLYQTNTSGTCTLFALCKNGDRSAQEEVSSCPHYCEQTQVFYPTDVPAIGRWNSLFGCSMTELNDSALLNRYLDAGIGRLVVRL